MRGTHDDEGLVDYGVRMVCLAVLLIVALAFAHFELTRLLLERV
jgi:hypothetical protein